MTEPPQTNIDLIRTLIGAVDGGDQDTIAALTAEDVHFRFGNTPATTTKSEHSKRLDPFVRQSLTCTTRSSMPGRSTAEP